QPGGSGEEPVLSLVKKQPALVAGEGEPIQIEFRRGDTLMTVLMENGASRDEAADAVRLINARFDTRGLAEGDAINLIVAPDEDGRNRPVRTAIGKNKASGVVLASSGDFIYDEGNIGAMQLRGAGWASTSQRPTLFASVYATALRHGLPEELVDGLVRILSFDVDYQRRVQPGD